MGHFAGIVHAGIGSVGNTRQTQFKAAQRYGSQIVTAREVYAQGIEAALRHLPEPTA